MKRCWYEEGCAAVRELGAPAGDPGTCAGEAAITVLVILSSICTTLATIPNRRGRHRAPEAPNILALAFNALAPARFILTWR
ncbi:hypothetical protein B6U99_06115 [Candidatus Geothermarchaeota archaeon ex4572_27]|nr:MAG: hypothetical protein B6U99_06115 [Candidatus Geothermarchaeota archaeon ex4572_27]